MPELFWHPSTLHGQAHVTRVMVHAIRLVEATGQGHLASQLWASVFLHDLARTHDGVCHRHGADAAQRLRDEPDLQRRLAEGGITAVDYPAIEAAVTAHSAPKEVSCDHPHWPLIALLKDADGLDRVRLGDLDPRYLRHPQAKETRFELPPIGDLRPAVSIVCVDMRSPAMDAIRGADTAGWSSLLRRESVA